MLEEFASACSALLSNLVVFYLCSFRGFAGLEAMKTRTSLGCKKEEEGELWNLDRQSRVLTFSAVRGGDPLMDDKWRDLSVRQGNSVQECSEEDFIYPDNHTARVGL